MSLWPRIRAGWRQIVRGRAVDRDLDAELEAWTDLAASAEARTHALSPDEARRRVLARAGGVTLVKEEVRAARGTALIETVARDVRLGLRQMRRHRGVTAAALVTTTLGIGATVATLGVVDAVLLRPLAYARASELVVVMHDRTSPVAPANFLDWQRQARSFAAMAAAEHWTPSAGGDSPERIYALRVTPGLFPLLGVEPARGRVLSTAEPGAREVVIGDGFWRRRFGADPAVVGQELRLDGEPYRIVGVMPPDFAFAPFWATRAELWASMDLAPRATSRGGQSLRVFARLAPGVTVAAAQTDVTAVTTALEQQFPGTNRNVTVTPLAELVVGDVRPALLVVLAAVMLVLLMGCANVAHMLLARASGRAKEVAVRTALGAGRGRLVRQFLTESLVLALVGGAAGALLAHLSLGVVVSLSAGRVPRIETAAVDARVLGLALVVSMITGLVAGLVPALRARTPDLASTLREADRGSTVGRGAQAAQRALIVSEIALAVVLLIGAGLMIRSFAALRGVDPGFDPDRLIVLDVSVAGSAEAPAGRRTAFYRAALERVAALPGVASASAINHAPLAGDLWGWPYAIEGRPAPSRGDEPTAAYRVVLPGYFETVRLPLTSGRDFDDRDDLDTPPVVIVNEWMARHEWPGVDPIGRRVRIQGLPTGDWATVVGVAANAARGDWAEPPAAEFYLPYLQHPSLRESSRPHYSSLAFVVRAESDPATVLPAVRQQIRSLARDVTLSDPQLMRDVVARATAGTRFLMSLFAAFGAVAVVLAGVGIYGVMSYMVTSRRQEIGIRLALGASPRGVLLSVVRSGAMLTAGGIGLGLLAAFCAAGLVSGLIYGVSPTDAGVFVVVTLALGAVALAGSFVPAWRASVIAPGDVGRS